MHFHTTFLLSFVASALAYSVTSPSNTSGWDNAGDQELVWERVVSDRQNFTVLLVNQGTSYSQVLASNVDGTLLKTDIDPPSGGWPTGSGFRINLVESPQNLNSILTQSSEFNITVSTKTTTSASSGTSSTPAGGATGTPSTPNGALPALSAQSGLLGALALMGLILA